MPKQIRLTGVQVGGDISTVDLYHTSITGSNLITANLSSSLLASPGIVVTVPDTATVFYAKCNDGGFCQDTTGSITASVYSPVTRYFTVNTSGSDGSGTVQINYPIAAGPSSTTLVQSVNFNDYPIFTIQANSATYPNDQFQGWYYSPSSSTPFSVSPTLSVTLNTYTDSDDFYAFFTDK